MDSEVKAGPRLRIIDVDLQRAALQIALLGKTSSLRPFLLIALPDTPGGRFIWGGGGKHSIFNSVNRLENVHGNFFFPS